MVNTVYNERLAKHEGEDSYQSAEKSVDLLYPASGGRRTHTIMNNALTSVIGPTLPSGTAIMYSTNPTTSRIMAPNKATKMMYGRGCCLTWIRKT